MKDKTNKKMAQRGLAAVIAALSSLCFIPDGTAQVVIGGSGGPAVVTDFDAILDPYGRADDLNGRASGFFGPGGPLLIPDPSNPPRSRLLVQPNELGAAYPLPAGRAPGVSIAQPSAPESSGGRIVLRKPGERKVASAPAAAPTPQVTQVPKAEPAPAPKPAPAAAPKVEPERPAAPPPEPKIAAAAAPPPPEPKAQPAPVPQPEPKAEPKAEPAPQPVASVPASSGLPTPGNPVRVAFQDGSAQLSPAAQKTLGNLAEELRANAGVKIQLNGYASAADGSTSAARRTALLRTLAVRSFLIEAGVERLRMNVRALGDNTDVEPKDRVDVEALSR